MTTAGPSSGPSVRPPDVLVIVMDCVRASDFPGAPNAAPMPFVERLRRESVVFPKAASVAPWTLPSHASIFTGLYPWEHGCHGRASLRLDPRFDRLAQLLRADGYRSLSLSGNPIISPFYGLVDGFDASEWGEWWEQVHRVKFAPSHRYRAARDGRMPEAPELSFRDRAGRAIKTMLTRYPSMLALGDAAMRRTVDPEGRWGGAMNLWIEPDLDAWLREQPTGAPTFCFVNMIDAHEPYLMDPVASSGRSWWAHMRIPQDVLALMAGPTPPAEADLRRLHDLYRDSLAVVDRRLARLVEIYRAAGRWENTLLILTSDHGQAFGEHGMIWHGVRTDEEMLRVPLLARFPGGTHGGTAGRGWATPMDCLPTVLESVRGEGTSIGSGTSLARLIDSERPTPLFCAGDGTEWNRPFLERLTPERRTQLNLFSVAAYVGETKVVVEGESGAVRAYDLSQPQPVEVPADRQDGAVPPGVIDEARRALTSLMHPSGPGISSEVDERLRSWGYG